MMICGIWDKRKVAASLLLVLVGLGLITLTISSAVVSCGNAVNVEDQGIFLPIVMYHSVVEDAGKACDYIITADTLESDLRYLKQNGYTPVLSKDLIGYVKDGTPLPEKPVMITFDDGCYNNLSYVLPLLKQYEMKAVVSVVGAYSDRAVEENDPNPLYAYLTWADIRALHESGCVEIGNHTYDMHEENGARRGCTIKAGESEADYQSALREDLGGLQKKLQDECGVKPVLFAYPYGFISDESRPVMEQLGFQVTLSCYDKKNYITRQKECLFGLNRLNRPSGISTESFMERLLSE
ncbi:polysaccharide deacetylase family protein [Candidatus Soleaferrea massiliensis]|uniref:polysaccharide deacetylase family protein n=1 Tax=Candidatus Soleaferrea massiliensis TaxID=1470354 RepID=UPI00058BD041|nr:polysaccharide deacetylase family protein [Candidatus Soleaferrea massiliensis]